MKKIKILNLAVVYVLERTNIVEFFCSCCLGSKKLSFYQTNTVGQNSQKYKIVNFHNFSFLKSHQNAEIANQYFPLQQLDYIYSNK